MLDIIAQHFFQKTPTFFALSYFSLYLDYRYPRGGTGALPKALEQFVLGNGGEIRRETEITSVDPGRNQATDARGNVYQYRKLVWAADLKTLYRVVDLASLTDSKVIGDIETRKQALAGKVGGDSVFTLYLTVDLESRAFCADIAALTSSTRRPSPVFPRSAWTSCAGTIQESPARFIDDRPRIEEWLRRFLDYTTYEISCPVLRDASLAPEGKTGLIISSLFDYSLTKHIEAMGWYDEFKKLMADRMIQVLDASIYPGLEGRSHRQLHFNAADAGRGSPETRKAPSPGGHSPTNSSRR